MEIKTIVLVPQLGKATSVRFPSQLPHVKCGEKLSLIGWFHTQSQLQGHLTVADVMTQIPFMESFNARFITLSMSFTPGSVTLDAFQLTEAGYTWGKECTEPMMETPGGGFSENFANKSLLILSDRIVGSFQVPMDNIWNYYFMNSVWNSAMQYDVKQDIPKPFYSETHRPIHFVTFNEMESANVEAGDEDVFA